MFRQTLHPKKILKNAAAALLMLGLSGAYALFCCQAALAAGGGGSEHHAASAGSPAEHCKFSKLHASETSSAAAAAAARLSAFECCPLKLSFFVAKLEKTEFPQQTLAAANDLEGFFKAVRFARRPGLTDFSYRAPVGQNRALHLRNCVFRI